jgi:hypothetical protein
MQLDLPGNLKTDHPIPLDLPKHKAQGPANLLVGKPAGKEEKSEERRPAKKPVENKLVCGPGSAGRRCTIPGYHWNLTQGVYDSIEQNCGDLDQRLTREEDKTTPVRVRGMLACLPTPLSPECASASQEVAKADVKIGHLREKYQQCVTRDLHRHARVIISQR